MAGFGRQPSPRQLSRSESVLDRLKAAESPSASDRTLFRLMLRDKNKTVRRCAAIELIDRFHGLDEEINNPTVPFIMGPDLGGVGITILIASLRQGRIKRALAKGYPGIEVNRKEPERTQEGAGTEVGGVEPARQG